MYTMYIYIWCRLKDEEREQEALREKTMKEEKMRGEEELRDKLLKNVQKLEQRKLEVQRELVLRTTVDGGQLKSAVVVPNNE